MGLVKLAEAAIATAIIAACGDIPISAQLFITIGAISTTNAAVGIIVVAIAVMRYKPTITGHGP
jgi:hypothetical protein